MTNSTGVNRVISDKQGLLSVMSLVTNSENVILSQHQTNRAVKRFDTVTDKPREDHP